MRRILALLRKELVQHGWLFVGLATFLPLCWGLLVMLVLLAPATVTYVEAHATFLRFFVPLVGLALGNRLVVAEYHGRTQLFLEALPIGRFDVLIVKLALGLFVLEAVALGSLGGTLVLASTREPIDLAFIVILAARTSAFVLCMWAFLFAMGLLGKLRVPMYLTLGIVLGLIADTTELELLRFGPFALAYGDDLPLERERLPSSDLLVTLAITGAWLALAVVLATVREGSVAETLAKPMSQRERVTVGIVFFAILVTWIELDPPNDRPPLVWPDRGVARSTTLPIEVQYVRDDARDDADALVATLERELGPLAAALGWDALPRVRIALGERLDGRTFEPVEVGEDDGLLLRANFADAPEWDEDAFVSEVVAAAIDDRTDGRSVFEPNGWVRDGIAGLWPHRDAAELPRDVVLRALFATRARGPDPSRIAAWDTWRERDGPPAARALATTGLHVLARERGTDRVLALGRALFREAPPRDVRAVIGAWRRPVPGVIEAESGTSVEALSDAWSAWLRAQRARPELAPSIGALPLGEATIGIEHGSAGHDLVATIRLARPLAAGTPIALQHLGIGPFDEAIDPFAPIREERTWPEGALELTLRVVGRYGAGDRVWAAVDVESAEAGPLRLAMARLDVEAR